MSAKSPLFRLHAIFPAFAIWVFVSMFYYAPNLLSGQLIINQKEDVLFRAAKYVIGILFGAVYLLLSKNWRLLLTWLSELFLFLVVLLLGPPGIKSNTELEVVITVIVMTGIAFYASDLTERESTVLLTVLVIGATCVSTISYIEEAFFSSILSGYWESTGGFRSVSTMLNPNNLGLYLGGCIVLLCFSSRIPITIQVLAIPVICGALYLSGSRTAIAAALCASFIASVYGGGTLIRKKGVVLLCVISVLSILTASLYSSVLLDNARLTDYSTGDIRLAKYYEYLSNIDLSYLIPDYYSKRGVLVSESGYFHVANSIGILGSLALIATFLMLINKRKFNGLFGVGNISRCYHALFVYYIVSMASENVISSFPNNQLFAICIGITVGSCGKAFNMHTHAR